MNPSRTLRALLVLGVCALGCERCLPRHEVASVPTHPYPSCGDGDLPEGEVLDQGVLRNGPIMQEPVVERYEVRKRDCLYVITVRQEWARQITDVEAIFDEEWRPVRLWKRMTVPGEEDETEDIRLYELRNDPPTMTERRGDEVVHREIRGEVPIAVVGPGRALLTAWIHAAGLEVGETTRGPVLDFRDLYENIDEVALRRDPARDEESLGGSVEVYTVFGRESVFTDADGWIRGDLAGLRESESLDTPEPDPVPMHAPLDPVGTP
ncbi:MAG: hypothetical protein JJ863_28215 [Deltaproteobacteria bacterium]|nr:hypothetical protein [Deltaproteobacteria bacterium]